MRSNVTSPPTNSYQLLQGRDVVIDLQYLRSYEEDPGSSLSRSKSHANMSAFPRPGEATPPLTEQDIMVGGSRFVPYVPKTSGGATV
jgi:hypothetical protein